MTYEKFENAIGGPTTLAFFAYFFLAAVIIRAAHQSDYKRRIVVHKRLTSWKALSEFAQKRRALFSVLALGGLNLFVLMALSKPATLIALIAYIVIVTPVAIVNIVAVLAAAHSRVSPAKISIVEIFSYIEVILLWFACVYVMNGLVDRDGKTVYDFGSAFYFSVVTFTTVGYGDLTPAPDSRFYAAMEALVGYFVLALTVSAIVVIMSRRLRMADRATARKSESGDKS